METNNGKRGGNLVGKPHKDKQGRDVGGIKAVVTDAGNKPVELEGGEVIINKEASKKHWKELSRINQSAGNGVPINKPVDPHDEDPQEYSKGGKIEFNPNRLPNKWILNYAQKIKDEHPEIWKLGGNIYGNQAFQNLKRVSDRGYWLDSEEWFYIKWRSFVARHQGDFRIAGVVAMLKWVDKVDRGWQYMKNLIEEEIAKREKRKSSSKLSKGGELKKGIKTELEHQQTIEKYKKKNVSVEDVAKSIAKDHLKEDPRYYSKLAKMEGKMADGGSINPEESRKPSDFGKVLSSSSRFRPYETIFFNPPLLGKNNAKLVSYTWAYEWTEKTNWEGEAVGVRVSDWGNAEMSSETGRNIVHKYGVELPNGEYRVVSSESIPVVLGFVDKEQKKVFGNLATASKTLAQQQLKLAIMEAQIKEFDDAKQAIIKKGFPEAVVEPNVKWGGFKLQMGDAYVHISDDGKYDRERLDAVKGTYIDKRLSEMGIKPYPPDTYDLKVRIERQKKKIEQILKSQNMASGGKISEPTMFEEGGLVGISKPVEGNNQRFYGKPKILKNKSKIIIIGKRWNILKHFKELDNLLKSFGFDRDYGIAQKTKSKYISYEGSVEGITIYGEIRLSDHSPAIDRPRYIAEDEHDIYNVVSVDKVSDFGNRYIDFDIRSVEDFEVAKKFIIQNFSKTKATTFQSGGQVSWKDKSIKSYLEAEGFQILKGGVVKYGEVEFILWMQRKYTTNRGEKYMVEVGSPDQPNNPEDYGLKIAVLDSIKNLGEQKKGNASFVLDKIIEASDKTGTILQLFPQKQGNKGLSNKQLKDWYISRGFEIVDDENIMQRTPKHSVNQNTMFARGGQTESQKAKIAKVMGEFKRGTLKTSYGEKVTDYDQAIAIALSEAGASKYAEGGKVGLDDTLLIYYHEKQGNIIFAKNTIYLWLYDDMEAATKLQSGEYDYVFFPLVTRYESFRSDYVPPLKRIWTKKYQNQHRGSNRLIGVIEAWFDEASQKLYIMMMTTKKSYRRKGVMSGMIKNLREYLNVNQEDVIFDSPTKEGSKVMESKKYSTGGLIAPNGKPSNLTPEQYELVRTKAFKDWFGDWENDPKNASKVVDENGEPMVVYRGTTTSTQNVSGLWLSESKSYAEGFGEVMQYFVKILKPMPEELFNKTWMVDFDSFDGRLGDFHKIVVKDPTQIKLADGRNTTFDGNNPDIRFESGGNLSKPYFFYIPQKIRRNASKPTKNKLITTLLIDWFKSKGHTFKKETKNTIKDAKGNKIEIDADNDYDIIFFTFGKEESGLSATQIFSFTIDWDKHGLVEDKLAKKDRYNVYLDDLENKLKMEVLPLVAETITDKTELSFGEMMVRWMDFIKNAESQGVNVERDSSSVSNSRYYTLNRVGSDIKLKVRLSDHELPSRYYGKFYAQDYSFTAPISVKKFQETLDYLKSELNMSFAKGGRTIAQTPAPMSERIKGSKVNPRGSSKSGESGKNISFSQGTIDAITEKVEQHNRTNPDKKVTLAVAKAVVRRGMGAYSASHRPTIGGGKPNSRVAWGLARLNAFTYKVVHGKSKSGKYSQDDDLLDELGIKHQKFENGGKVKYNIYREFNEYADGAEVDKLINDGIVELKMYDTTNEHSKLYGFDAQKPLYIQSIIVAKEHRNKGIGSKVMEYINDYAKKNEHDLIFGHITQKAEPNIDVIKSMMVKSGFNTCEGNNDFYKKIYAKRGLLAPNGKPTNLTPEQYKLVRTPEFKAWFGDWENDPENSSKVVDENGEPKVFWHYSNNNIKIFNTIKSKRENYNLLSKGSYFGDNLDDVEKGFSKRKYKKPYFISIKKNRLEEINFKNSTPSDDLHFRKQMGYDFYDEVWIKVKDNLLDGLYLKNAREYGHSEGNSNQIVIYNPTSVKLADGTNTTFDENNPDIRFEQGGEVQALGFNERELENWKEENRVKQRAVQNPIVSESALKLSQGEITQEQYLEIVKKQNPIYSFKEVPKLPTLKEIVGSLTSNKIQTGIIGFTKFLDDNQYVASRLDIPAYYDYDVWVVSVHDGTKEGQAIGYGQTAYLKDVTFKTSPKTALRIATGIANKSTFARMFGYWINKEPNEVREMAVKYLNDPNWIQVGMNPYRHSWFYDKEDGMPLVKADYVIQVGALVLAKNAVKTSPSDPMFAVDKSNPDIKFQKGGQTSNLIAPNGRVSNLDAKQYKLVRTPEFKAWFGDWENDPENASKVVDENGEPLVVYRGMSTKKRLGNVFEYNVNMFGNTGMSGRQTNKFAFYFTDNRYVAKDYADRFSYGTSKPVVKQYFLKSNNPFEAYIYKNQFQISFKELYDHANKSGEEILVPDWEIGESKMVKFIERSRYARRLSAGWKYNEDVISLNRGEEPYKNDVFYYFVDWDEKDSNQEFWKTYLKELLKYDGVVFYEDTFAIREYKDGRPIFLYDRLPKTYCVWDSNQIKLADGSNTTFDADNPDVRFEDGGAIENGTLQLSDLANLDVKINKDNWRLYHEYVISGGELNPQDYIALRHTIESYFKDLKKPIEAEFDSNPKAENAFKKWQSATSKLNSEKHDVSNSLRLVNNLYGLSGDLNAKETYHFTTPSSLLSILEQNEIYGEGETSGVSTTTNAYFDHPMLTQVKWYGEGNKPYTFADLGVRIDLDLDRLRNDGYKIRKGSESIGTFEGEEELRIGGWEGIKNAAKYINSIQVDRKIVGDDVFQEIVDAANKLNIKVVEKTDYEFPVWKVKNPKKTFTEYQQAKKTGENPDLVRAVENLVMNERV